MNCDVFLHRKLKERKERLVWIDTLLPYLAGSNEDEIVVQLFDDELISIIGSYLNDPVLKWLEVGPGPGTKTMGIYEGLRKSEYFDKVSLSVVEPSSFWNNHNRSVGHERRFSTIYPVAFERLNASKLATFNFITLVHVVYERGIREALVDRLETLREINTRHVVSVVVEAPGSDFSRLREKLSQSGSVMEWAQPANALERELARRNFTFDTCCVHGQECRVSREDTENDNHWLFPFLLGCSFEKYRTMNSAEQSRVTETVRNYLREKNYEALSVPDMAFTVFL